MRRMLRAIVSICLLCLLLAAGCISPDDGNGTTVPGTVPGTAGETPLRTLAGITHPGPGERTYTFSILLDRKVINRGEAAPVNLTLINLGNRPLTLRPFPPGVRVTDRCGSAVKTIPYGSGEWIIPPGETLVSLLPLDMIDDQNRPLTPGRYRVELFWEEDLPLFNYTSGPPPPLPTRTGDVIIPEWDVGPIVIRYPEGAREGSIEVNHTVTVAGLPVILERLECSEEQTVATFLYPIPSGTLPPGIPSASIPPPPPDTGQGLFSIDGGTECPFLTMAVTRVEGLWRVNGDLPPVSRNAQDLNIVIPELAGQEGPWVFRVQIG